jgi:two-component system, sensor histidine kinase LadS
MNIINSDFRSIFSRVERIFYFRNIFLIPLTALLLFIILYFILSGVIFSIIPEYREMIILSITSLLVSMFLFIFYNLLSRRIFKSLLEFRDDLVWKDLIIENSRQIILFLDNAGRIISYNLTLKGLINSCDGDITGKLFKDIFQKILYDDHLRMTDILHNNLDEAYLGNESEMICACRKCDSDEVLVISFRMIPVKKGIDIENILIIGMPEHSDLLTKNFLLNENSSYELNNNISLIYLLSYRLTRNLDGVLPKDEILMTQIALQEVLINSLEHGNLEIDFDMKTELWNRDGNYWELLLKECDWEHFEKRKIFISYTLTREKVIYVIRDQGKGFDWKKYMSLNGDTSGRMADNLHGAGLHLVKRVFRVTFNETGNEVTLEKIFSKLI